MAADCSSAALWCAVALTLAPVGPFHTRGNRVVDARGRTYLARGTTLPAATLDISQIRGEDGQFGVYSPSSFVTIRQRLNMNAVRLPVNLELYRQDAAYRGRIREIVRRANQFELLVILAAEGSGPEAADFWARCAGEFKGNPNVFFAVGGEDATAGELRPLIAAIRAAGAQQPIVAAGRTGEFPLPETNLIYEVAPRYATTRTDEDRDRQFGWLAERAPVLASGMDPQLDTRSAECEAFPPDPAEAARLVGDSLNYFDRHHISWTLSSFQRGRLLTEYRTYTWLKLDDGWTCGVVPTGSGIAMILLAHLWSADPHGLLAVNSPGGGLTIARGGVATAYGRVMAERQMEAKVGPLPLALGNVAIRVTDSAGVTRPAPLLFTAAGWGHITFLVPENSAKGPAEVAVVRADGSRTSTKILVADTAPALWTATDDGRGPVIGQVTQQLANGTHRTFPAWECSGHYDCRAVPIPLGGGATTTLLVEGSGIRHAGPNAAIRVMVGDVAAPVLSYGARDERGRDQIRVRLPDTLRGMGETDLFLTLNGAISNVVRIHCGRME